MTEQALQNETEELHLFDRVNVYADIASNHHYTSKLYEELVQMIEAAGAIPKIQLYSAETFDRSWPLPTRFVPSVFRPADVEWVMQHNPLALKVASVESTYWELLSACMETRLPLIVSTGGMSDDELLLLLEHIENYSGNVCLMHCISMYPTHYKHAQLCRIPLLSEAMEDAIMEPYVGWSSHHNSRITAKLLPIALAYGADQIEVHVKIEEKENETPDEECALAPNMLQHIMDKLPMIAAALGECEEDEERPDREQVMEWRKRWSND